MVCLETIGEETGFSAQNQDRLKNSVFSGPNFRQESRTGLKKEERGPVTVFKTGQEAEG